MQPVLLLLYTGINKFILKIIIHSKYFSVSDWLKAITLVTVNLEECNNQSTDDVKRAAQLQVNAPLTEKT